MSEEKKERLTTGNNRYNFFKRGGLAKRKSVATNDISTKSVLRVIGFAKSSTKAFVKTRECVCERASITKKWTIRAKF